MLKVEHVSYRYPNGERDVLQDVCCTLEDGQLSAIVGPSGSGKTTLLSILAGLDSPSEGSVSIDGEDYKSLDLDRCRRERIAMIFQAFHLFPLLNVVENVCFAMELNGVAKSKAVGPAKELLGMVGIGEEKHKRYPAHLSGGEQQRVAIARALVNNPSMIIADEPTGNLDPARSYEIMLLLEEINNLGTTVLVVTHERELVERFTKRVIAIDDGKVISDGMDGYYHYEEQ
jgi:cell division transport system ATP-binding protein